MAVLPLAWAPVYPLIGIISDNTAGRHRFVPYIYKYTATLYLCYH